jgi:hypothetical protein
MEPKNSYFTRRIIGPPREILLGMPASDGVEPSWEDVDLPAPAVGRRSASKWSLAAVALVITVAGISAGLFWQANPRPDDKVAAVTAVLPTAASSSPVFPIPPAAEQGQTTTQQPTAIAVENSTFAPAPAEPRTQMPQGQPQGPIQGQPAGQPKPPAAGTVLTKDADKGPSAPLMVLDAASKAETLPRTAASVPVTQKPGGTVPIPARSNSSAPIPVPRAQEETAAVTIVDIARDGSFALITNPSTRLPERIVAGQKIFTGESVVKIDAAAGKVQFDKRSVGMQ